MQKNREIRRIMIVGGYGFDNLGDDLILRASLKSIREIIPNAEIVVLSSNPFETARRHIGEIISYSPEALIRQIIFRIMSQISDSCRNFVLDMPPGAFRNTCAYICNANLILSLGGGYLNDNSRTPYPQFRLAELAFFGLCRKKVCMCAHELGPFRRISSIFVSRLALKYLTYATVRDRRSYEVLSNLGFPRKRIAHTADESWTYDPVRSLRLRTKHRKRNKGLILAVNLMPLQILPRAILSSGQNRSKTTENQILVRIANCFDPAEFKLNRLYFLSMSSRDTEIALRLRSILKDRVQVDILDTLDSQYQALSCCDALIGMRMHSIIMAAQLGVPPIAITVLPKVRGTMDDLGLSKYALDVHEVTTHGLRHILSQTLANSKTIRNFMRVRVLRLKEIARQNMEPIQRCLSNPKTL